MIQFFLASNRMSGETLNECQIDLNKIIINILKQKIGGELRRNGCLFAFIINEKSKIYAKTLLIFFQMAAPCLILNGYDKIVILHPEGNINILNNCKKALQLICNLLLVHYGLHMSNDLEKTP